MISKWDAYIEASNKSEFEFDVHKELHQLSGDIISRTDFGSNFSEGKRIFELQEQQTVLVLQSLRKVYIPGSRFLPTKQNRTLWNLEKETREVVTKLIEKNKNTKQNSNTLLAAMISPSKKDGILELKEIVDECKTFCVAGKQTTANLLTWAFLLLGLHQEWQNKAREEVDRVCGQNAFPRADNLADLKIVTLILNETLRLYPPAGMMTRQVLENVKLTCGLDILADTRLFLAMTAVHHNVRIWGEDANVFNPMRFLEPRNHLALFFPFGLGSTVCVGQNLVFVEAKIVLAMIISRYSFVVSPLYVHTPMQSLALQPQFGAQIIFTRS
ncbi:putative cytochrome P450 [Helianthus annuus]|uniref:Cytochrome P450 n=2 Tax=Helianthus annuus TaxID=4232 RepID=A0A251UYW8_HELAN|nr:putative cytochrome P450 [Helianthus annuus]KAJ0580229.1 putative cytochrome P450 [Helianthus annuus]KAJ0587694.1 putative cytochrome P450 [Helianthus annuus]KAJ0596172.1 putative cytochrome P450 [Helianthus annuus]KAJ0756823.1 putative cytochrome P450 [Helianthus annuus]